MRTGCRAQSHSRPLFSCCTALASGQRKGAAPALPFPGVFRGSVIPTAAELLPGEPTGRHCLSMALVGGEHGPGVRMGRGRAGAGLVTRELCLLRTWPWATCSTRAASHSSPGHHSHRSPVGHSASVGPAALSCCVLSGSCRSRPGGRQASLRATPQNASGEHVSGAGSRRSVCGPGGDLCLLLPGAAEWASVQGLVPLGSVRLTRVRTAHDEGSGQF